MALDKADAVAEYLGGDVLALSHFRGAAIPGYFNIWHWILPQLTTAERGGRRADPKPEAILKYAHHPIAMLAGLWQQELDAWREQSEDPRPPVFILVCKTTKLAKVIYEWLAEDRPPAGIPSIKIDGFRNNGVAHTIRVDSKVVTETDDPSRAKSDEDRWMRFQLDSVGRTQWPRDKQGRPIYPQGFEELAKKLDRPLHPPGRDVRCIVSVAMLTEGWDCNTVTHIVGLRPFMSQLLCEQVVGRGLRRTSYRDIDEDGRFTEEVAKVFGVPFEVIPFKTNPTGPAPPPPKRHHVCALPEKAEYEIFFPRVEGYTQAVRNRVTVDWDSVPQLPILPGQIPPEVEMKALNVNNQGRMSLSGPGRIDDVSLKEFRSRRRMQELVFELATVLARDYARQPTCQAPAHVLFPQLARLVSRYIESKVRIIPPADVKDLFLAPYYGWLIERLVESIRPDTSLGEVPELPRYEAGRGPGSTADVDYWTTKDVREIVHSHLSYMVADTLRWEQTTAYYIDRHVSVAALAKNAGLGFYIPYVYNGERHDYLPDFLIRLKTDPWHLILETKGWDPLEEVKAAAARRWVNAVNAEGSFGRWAYVIAKKPEEVDERIDAVIKLINR